MSENNERKKQAEVSVGSVQNPCPEAENSSFCRVWKIFFWEAFLFCLTLGLGIAAAYQINEILKIEKVVLPVISLWQFLFYFLIATLFILLISLFGKFKKGKEVIFKGVFILAVFLGGLLLLNIWIPGPFAPILMGILIFWWLKQPLILIHNLAVILGIAGIGAFLGLHFTPQLVITLLIILSIYDFIAVYKTKHMIKMAKEMITAGAILALIVPQEISGFKANLKEVSPGGKFLILGGGDIVFPLLLCASVAPAGIINSLIVAIFALVGLFTSFYFFISQKIHQPIPALPPIALFSIIGFLITKIL